MSEQHVIVKVLVALSADAKALVKGSEARKRIEKVLDEQKDALVAQWGKSDEKATKEEWKKAGIHAVVISMVARRVWPKVVEKAKIPAKAAKVILSLVPADPAEARAWLRGLADLIRDERPFPKSE